MRRYPFVKQKDTMQCGIACIESICRFYGQKYSSHYLSTICQGTSTGTSLLSLKRGAEKLGIEARAVRIHGDPDEDNDDIIFRID